MKKKKHKPNLCTVCTAKTFNKSGKCTACVNDPLRGMKGDSIGYTTGTEGTEGTNGIEDLETKVIPKPFKRRVYSNCPIRFPLPFVKQIQIAVLTEKCLNGNQMYAAYDKIANEYNLTVAQVRYLSMINLDLRTDNPKREEAIKELDRDLRIDKELKQEKEKEKKGDKEVKQERRKQERISRRN